KETSGESGAPAEESSTEVGVVAALALSPSSPGSVFAGTARGVFKAANGAWAAAEGLLSDLYVSALVADAARSEILFAATDGAGVFKSTDSGKSWAAVNEGLANFFVTSLAMGGGSGSKTLYAATDAGVFKSTTEGASWVPTNEGITDLTVSALV